MHELTVFHAVANEDHSQNDCFVCLVLSYGEEGYIYAKDGKISINELMDPIKGNNCPSLAGKPKLFFIQVNKSNLYPLLITI